MAIVKIQNIRRRMEGRACIASAVVAGEEVWFSSEDAPLHACPEAFLSAFLIPAQLKKDQLGCRIPVCETWHANVTRLLEVSDGWWSSTATPPMLETRKKRRGKRWWRKTALFFTAGVDSFHTLYGYPGKIHTLVNVHGYDIALGNEARQEEAHRSCREVARARGISFFQIKTNLREHSYFRKNNWDHTHGGAMAAVAHLLGASHDDFLLSSSTRRDDTRVWGSTWQIDPFWSSAAIRFSGWGEDLSRAEKMERIADEPLVREHLRVCWKSNGVEANCGLCPKCTRTMVSLEWAGKLDKLIHRFSSHPCLVEAVSTWKPAPIRSVAEFDPVFTRAERLPEPLRSAMIGLREKMIRQMEEREACRLQAKLVASE